MFTVEYCADKQVLRKLPYQYVAHFNPCVVDCRDYFVAKCDDKIVGILTFRQSSIYDENAMSLSVISVMSEFKHKGVATQLLSVFVEYVLSSEKKAVVVTGYEPEGELYLKPLIARERLKNNLTWIERG